MSKPFLTAEWKNLILANYEVDPSVLKPYLPCHTELDFFNNTCYISLVGFLFANTRVWGLTFPFHSNFEEVNLRFYVRYNDAGVWKRGVVFIKEIVPRLMIRYIANTLYGENYATHKMKHEWSSDADELSVAYYWKVKNEWNYIKAVAENNSRPIVAGSAEEFIAEHYWGYTFINDTCSGMYEVVHAPWKMYPVISYQIRCSALLLYGEPFAKTLSEQPRSVFLADGSPVSVVKGTKVFASLTS